MAKTQLTASITDHEYSKSRPREACYDDFVKLEEIELMSTKQKSDHTPIPSKKSAWKPSTMLFTPWHEDLRKDWMCLKKIENFDLRIQSNEKGVRENKEEIK